MPWIDELPSEIVESLPEELRENETLKRYNSLEDLARSHLEQRAAISQSIRIPPEEAGEEARKQFLDKLINNAPEVMLKPQFDNPEQSDEFFRTLGMPETPDEYENPEDANLSEAVEKQLREVLHGAKLTKAQYKKIAEDFAKMESEARSNLESAISEDMDKLKSKWGMTAEERFEAAKRANEQYFPERDFNRLTAAEIEGLYNISKSLHGKGAQAARQPKEESDRLTPKEALRRAEEIMANPAYWDRSNPQQRHLIEKRLELLKMAGYTDSLESMKAS